MNLVDRFFEGLNRKKYLIHSPTFGNERSLIFVISHIKAERNKIIFKTLQKEKVFISYREGLLRFSPHLYNTPQDIDKALTILNKIN